MLVSPAESMLPCMESVPESARSANQSFGWELKSAMWGEFTQWGKRDRSPCPSSKPAQGNLALVSGSSVSSCWYFSHRFCLLQNVDLLQFYYRMLTFLPGFNAQVPPYIQMEDLLQAPARVENGSSCGTLERSLGDLEALPGNQSQLLF